MYKINWVTPIAMATAMAESEWKRELKEANALFKIWRKQHPNDPERDWLSYSGQLGIRSRPSGYTFETIQTRVGPSPETAIHDPVLKCVRRTMSYWQNTLISSGCVANVKA